MFVLMGCSSHENDVYTGLGRISFDVAIAEVTGASVADMPIALTLSSVDGQYTHTWTDIRDFPVYENFHVGRYIAKASIGDEGVEGFDCPCYIGSTEFEVKDGITNNVDIICSLTQSIVRVKFQDADASTFRVAAAVLHSSGAGFVDVMRDELRQVFITPGLTHCSVTIANDQQREVTVATDLAIEMQPSQAYDFTVSIDSDSRLTVACAGQSVGLNITPQLFDSQPPLITGKGFSNNVAVNITEGYLSVPLIMDIDAPAGIKALALTLVDAGPSFDYLPSESNLLDPGAQVFEYGLVVDKQSETAVSVDFTAFVESLKVANNASVTFAVQATDRLGRVSTPMMLRVNLSGLNITVTKIDPPLIGENIASVYLHINAPNVDTSDFTVSNGEGDAEKPLEIVGASIDSNEHEVRVDVRVPDGKQDIHLNVYYLDMLKYSGTVRRKVPVYRLSADAFATTVRLQVIADDPAVKAAITKYAVVKVEDSDISILSRDPETGLIVCTGFTPSTGYKLSTVVIDGDFVASVDFKTESALELPDGDFEDAAATYKYKGLPSGGVYSSTAFPIFNMQNLTDIDVWWPKKYWTSINAKTFCRQPSNRNTWFMQLSAVSDFSNKASGTKSICISSVGWSFTGSDIEPYVQSSSGYQPYSGNMPAIDHVSAGYLFLGSYSVDPSNATESYTEGISFTSRPSSLNGFYKYTPDATYNEDRGWARVELIHKSSDGTETVIATGQMEFANTSFFRSFNIPLVYGVYNLNATAVKIIFCSSVFSDGLSFDDPSVPVSANLPEACFKGSSLWIDNLSFSY